MCLAATDALLHGAVMFGAVMFVYITQAGVAARTPLTARRICVILSVASKVFRASETAESADACVSVLLWFLARHLQAACDSVLMDYDSLREQHSDLGTAAVIVMVGGDGGDDSTL
jgi:hypothetical protein